MGEKAKPEGLVTAAWPRVWVDVAYRYRAGMCLSVTVRNSIGRAVYSVHYRIRLFHRSVHGQGGRSIYVEFLVSLCD